MGLEFDSTPPVIEPFFLRRIAFSGAPLDLHPLSTTRSCLLTPRCLGLGVFLYHFTFFFCCLEGPSAAHVSATGDSHNDENMIRSASSLHGIDGP